MDAHFIILWCRLNLYQPYFITTDSKPPPKGKDVGYTFEVRNIQDTPPSENLFKKMDFDENKEISKDEVCETMFIVFCKC